MTTDRNLQIANYFASALKAALEGMAGDSFVVEQTKQEFSLNRPLVWRQTVGSIAAPVLVETGEELMGGVAEMVLGAPVGSAVSDADTRATWQEIMLQTVSGLGSALSAALGYELAPGNGSEASVSDADTLRADWHWFRIRCGSREWSLRSSWPLELSQLLSQSAVRAAVPAAPASGTFDLLMGVALPVTVSFGKRMLQIRDVLKLSSGSIVELDRLISEPVDVIVNGCIIARGEVVVVDGNYGVRVTTLASREERLRTGMGDSGATAVAA